MNYTSNEIKHYLLWLLTEDTKVILRNSFWIRPLNYILAYFSQTMKYLLFILKAKHFIFYCMHSVYVQVNILMIICYHAHVDIRGQTAGLLVPFHHVHLESKTQVVRWGCSLLFTLWVISLAHYLLIKL